MRDYLISRRATFLLTPDPKLRVSCTDLDLFRGQSRKFYLQHYGIGSFTKIYGRRPCFRCQRIVRNGRLLQCGEQSANAIAKALKLEAFKAGGAGGFNH
jgi:hypothetical protein